MDTKLLKQKILDLAIRGKLVPQDPNDEPASVLLERIRAEREKLIAEGKLKRTKITSDNRHYKNVPFEVPESWEWCKVEDFSFGLQYGTSEKSHHEGFVPVLRMGNISRHGTIDYSDLVYSSNENDIVKYSLQFNDLLFNRTNSSEWVGKTAIYKAEKPALYAGYLIRIRTFVVYPDFINFVMNSSYHRDWCNQVKTDAVNQSNINAQRLSKLQIPLPPLPEQKRIVAEIERWFVLIDEIEKNENNLQDTIKQTKNKILDLAIHGKLVAQDPNDEPASELLKRIAPNATPCDTSHYGKIPFKIPNNWVWVRGFDIFNPMKSTKPLGEYFDYIDIDAIDNKRNKISAPKHLLSRNAPSRATRQVSKGDILFSMVRPYLRNIAKVDGDNYIASTGFFVCKPNKALTSDYCFNMMISDYVVDGLNNFMKGDNSPSINNENILSWLYPLPPVAEQEKIVKKINDTISKLNIISAEL